MEIPPHPKKSRGVEPRQIRDYPHRRQGNRTCSTLDAGLNSGRFSCRSRRRLDPSSCQARTRDSKVLRYCQGLLSRLAFSDHAHDVVTELLKAGAAKVLIPFCEAHHRQKPRAIHPFSGPNASANSKPSLTWTALHSKYISKSPTLSATARRRRIPFSAHDNDD